MTTTTAPPSTATPIHCRICGRPLLNATSRVLRAGERCRAGIPEHELAALPTGEAA